MAVEKKKNKLRQRLKCDCVAGTGSNACYVERTKNTECAIAGRYNDSKPDMLINTEWGAFGENDTLDFVVTEFDRSIDESSINPHKQIFEKMISGMYMGELTRLVLEKLINDGLLFGGKSAPDLMKRGKFFTKYVSEIEKYVQTHSSVIKLCFSLFVLLF